MLPGAVPIAIEFVLIGDQAVADTAAQADREFVTDLRVGVEVHHQRDGVADQTLGIARRARLDASFVGRLIENERRGQAALGGKNAQLVAVAGLVTRERQGALPALAD